MSNFLFLTTPSSTTSLFKSLQEKFLIYQHLNPLLLLLNYSNYNRRQKIGEKLFFPCETVHYGKSSISILKESFASIDKIFLLGGH